MSQPEVSQLQLDSLQLQQLSVAELVEQASKHPQVQLTKGGSLCFHTGSRTARSPNDRFICLDELTKDQVDWGSVNRPLAPEHFERLWSKAVRFLQDKPVYTASLQVGASQEYAIPVRVYMQEAWHCLFTHYLFVTPEDAHDVASGEDGADNAWSILGVPSMSCVAEDQVNSDAAVIINFSQRKVLLVGMRYAGEIKKAMFSVQNFLLPTQDVLSMHCAANQGEDGSTALFFGLSGTGKTTLSADPDRLLIGDDEHAWSADGLFNLEGGCYAKTIDLSEENEPVIWKAIGPGTLLENVKVNPETGIADYSNSSLTQNGRAAYPRRNIERRVAANSGGHPQQVIFLTCDLNGVLPPVSILDHAQAAYYFLSGYTALVGGTEIGQGTAVKSTFSTCFGAPFFPRPAMQYAQLLMRRLQQTGAAVYLVNTGWTGGGYGVGQRFPIPVTRRIVSAVLNNELQGTATSRLPVFNLAMPVAIDGIAESMLDPRQGWADTTAYQQRLRGLAGEFIANFEKYRKQPHDISAIIAAGPVLEG